MKYKGYLLAGAFVCSATLTMSFPAMAGEHQVRVSIPAQSLAGALLEFSKQSDQQLLFSSETMRGRMASPLHGEFSAELALQKLLAGTGLEAIRTSSGAWVIKVASVGALTGSNGIMEASDTPHSVVSDEIIVTARRKAESLQDVPQTVNAVGGEDLAKYNLQRFEDIKVLVPGLDLTSGARGFDTAASIRGVSFASRSQSTPTVEFYLNDAPMQPGMLFQSMFDTGQVEVLRGPQGTLRGRAAPSGAITITTRKADVSAVGGYLDMTGTTRGNVYVHGAINVPLVSDVLALRVAGVIDENESSGIKSINNRRDPWQKTKAVRASLQFEPTDNFSASVMYQYLKSTSSTYDQVIGAGSLGGTFFGSGYASPVVLPAGYNGPVLTNRDRSGITEEDFSSDERSHIVTAQANWSILNQNLTYVGSYALSKGVNTRPGDRGNLMLGYDYEMPTLTDSTYWTHEIRLGSEERIGGVFDYVLGVFHSVETGTSSADRGPSFTAGAFGDPRGIPDPFLPAIERYSSRTVIVGDRKNKETSFFGNLTAHLGEKTELSVGGRYILMNKDASREFLRMPGGFRLAPAGATGCSSAQVVSPYYAGYCDTLIAAGPLSAATVTHEKRKPFIYNAQLSHKFSDALMGYVNYGTSWRDGPAITVTNGGVGSDGGAGDPTLRALTFLSPEKSKTLEVGLKATLLDQRLRFSIAAYRQDFDGLIYYGTPTNYLADNGFTAPSIASLNFTSNADARVEGIDFDMSFKVTPRFRIGGGFSYADGRITDDFIPCNDGNFDGAVDAIQPTVADFLAAGTRVAMCETDRSVSHAPKWSLTAQSEYTAPISSRTDGFIRGLLTYYPKNPRDNEATVIGSYGLANLYAGIKDADGMWELSIFAKNITNTRQIISRDSLQIQSEGGLPNYFGRTGYYTVRSAPIRQMGLNIRYSFGVR